MGLHTVACQFCKGSKLAERVEEMSFSGEWVPNNVVGFAIAEAWIKQDGDRAPLRIATVECPRCAGKGEYDVESTPCKIF